MNSTRSCLLICMYNIAATCSHSPPNIRSQSAQYPLPVRPISALSPPNLRSHSALSTLSVRPIYALSPLNLRSQSAQSTLSVRSIYAIQLICIIETLSVRSISALSPLYSVVYMNSKTYIPAYYPLSLEKAENERRSKSAQVLLNLRSSPAHRGAQSPLNLGLFSAFC